MLVSLLHYNYNADYAFVFYFFYGILFCVKIFVCFSALGFLFFCFFLFVMVCYYYCSEVTTLNGVSCSALPFVSLFMCNHGTLLPYKPHNKAVVLL